MKVIVTGGGSGGHIAPVLAVAHELKKLQVDEVIYIGQKGDGLLDVVKEDPSIDKVVTISAGKLRRYSGEGWHQLLDVKSQLLNVRDVFRTLVGLIQSYRWIGREKPAVVFTRGGFISVPVALAARLRGVPYITHDADSMPSLANRLIARWAAYHAVTMPIAAYPENKTVVTGIPADHAYQVVSPADQKAFRRSLELEEYGQVLLVTGGGNGARALNMIVVSNAKYLLSRYPDLVILHFTGRALEQETVAAYKALGLGGARNRVKIFGFVTDFYRYSGAADVIVGRGGMSSLAEFAMQRKACVLVPSPQLSWNVKNSHVLARQGCIVELSEDQAEQPDRLGHVIGELLDSPARRQELGKALGKISRPRAAYEIADLTVKAGKR